MLNKNLLRAISNMTASSVTAVGPGLVRIIFVLIVNAYIHDKVDLARTLSDVAFVVALSMIFSMGFAITLLKRGNLARFWSVCQHAVLISPLAIALIFIAGWLGFVTHPLQMSLLYFGLIGYQNLRHFLIANTRLTTAALLEGVVAVLVVAGSLSAGWLGEAQYLIALYALPFMLLSLVVFLRAFFAQRWQFDLKLVGQAFYIGLTNLMSSGISWLLVPVATMFFIPEQALVIANISFLMGLVGLIPRIVLYERIGGINTAVTAKDDAFLSHESMRVKKITSSIFLLVFLAALILMHASSTAQLLLVGVVLLYVTLAQFVLIESSVANILHMNEMIFHYNLLGNLVAALVAMAAIGAISVLDSGQSGYAFAVYVALVIGILIRNRILGRAVFVVLHQSQPGRAARGAG